MMGTSKVTLGTHNMYYDGMHLDLTRQHPSVIYNLLMIPPAEASCDRPAAEADPPCKCEFGFPQLGPLVQLAGNEGCLYKEPWCTYSADVQKLNLLVQSIT